MMLRDLVALFAPRARVLAGDALLDRPVRWVHVTDLIDPSPYLTPGDLVLTNGIWRRRPADSSTFVGSIARAQASALGFGVRSQSARTPTDLVEACDRAALPLIEVTHDTPFTAFSEAVASYFADQRQRGLVRALRRDQALLSSLAQGTGLAGVLSMLARDHRLRLQLLTFGGQVLAPGPGSTGAEESAAIWRAVAGLRRPATIEHNGEALSAFPIVLQGRTQACLVCWKALSALTEEERAAVEHELAFLGIELAHARGRREVQQRFVAELLDLIGGGDARLTEVATRLRSLGVDPRMPMAALAIAPRDAQAATLEGLSEAAEGFLNSRGHAAAAPQGEGRVIVVVNVAADRDLLELADGLRAELRQDGWDVAIGVGGVGQTGAARIQRSVVQAEHALDLALANGETGAITSFTEVGSYSMLFAMQDAESRRSFVSALLGRLIEHDRLHGTKLVRSLDAYLSAGANWQRAADRLHVHVNTLRYRVSQIERITGRDLSSMDERVSFYIALRGAATLDPEGRGVLSQL